MSRKSKAVVFKERLKTISDCPVDIFRSISADDYIFNRIADAEQGNKEAISELSSLLFNTYISDKEANKATAYFLKKGVAIKDADSAVNLITYASLRDECLDSVALAKECLLQLNISVDEDLLRDAEFKSFVQASCSETDPAALKCELDFIKSEYRDYAEIYLLYRQKEHTGKLNAARLNMLSDRAALPPLSELPLFSGVKTDRKLSDTWHPSLISALNACIIDAWQDFWLRCIYEYCVVYLENDFTEFAENIATTLENRRFTPRTKLHALAFIEYIRDNTPEDTDEYERFSKWYVSTLESCVLDGTLKGPEDREAISELMKEAAYTSEYSSRKCVESGEIIGDLINHVKNRYTLFSSLTNHAKRGNRHMWEVTLSIKSESDVLPTFQNIKITERRSAVNRGGAVLEREKKRSQIICDGNIIINQKISPFVLDLVLDISYVSTTKCENVEIRIKRSHRQGEYNVLGCQIFVY